MGSPWHVVGEIRAAKQLFSCRVEWYQVLAWFIISELSLAAMNKLP